MASAKLPEGVSLNEERWFMPPIASVVMGTCTLPLDMIKVQLQAERTEYEGKNICQLIKLIIQERGCTGLYAGYTALVLSQIVYSWSRFSLYKLFKQLYTDSKSHYSFMAEWPDIDNFWMRVVAGASAGAIAGIIGNPPDLVVVRMQIDLKQPPENRRNYKHVFHAFWVMIKEEGMQSLLIGCSTSVYRGIGMTIGQLSIYEHVKILVMFLSGFGNTVPIHIFSSCVAATAATILTNPIDVMKTRVMTAEPGKFKGLWEVIVTIAKEGICTFYKGVMPSFTRQICNTVILWVVLEQLKIHWGIPPEETPTTSTAVLKTVFTTVATTVPEDTTPPP